jgi:LacI family transcriptional regulator
MSTSIYDVAKLAGVSISTVSRVINESGYVSEKTKTKVNAAMKSLGFVPSITAQNLVKHRTKLIGVYFPHYMSSMGFTSTYFMEFIRGANEVIMDKGHHLLLINEPKEEEELLSGRVLPQYTTFLKQKRIDGLLIGTAPLKTSSFFELVKDDAPMVYIGERLVSDRGLNVYALFRQNVWQSLDYLYERNHRKMTILYIAESQVSTYVTEYRQMKNDPELKVDVRQCPMDVDSYLEVVTNVFNQPETPTALMVMDLAKVQPVINYLNNIGLRVPEDVSMLSQEHHFKDGEQCFPAVTSAYVPAYQMGREASMLLFEYLEEKEAYNKQILLSPKIIERQSVADAKNP